MPRRMRILRRKMFRMFRMFRLCRKVGEARVCAQCGAGDGTLEPERAKGRIVWLHRECRRFWAKEHGVVEAPGGGLDFNNANNQRGCGCGACLGRRPALGPVGDSLDDLEAL